MAVVGGGLTYLTLRRSQMMNQDLQHQLAERTDALNSAQAPIVPLNPLLDALRAILFSVTDSMLVTDRAGAIVIANPAARQLIGVSVLDQSRPALAEWLTGATVAAERDHLAQLILAQTLQSGVKVQWAGARTLSFSLAPIELDGHRRPIGMVIVGRDMTREAELDRLKSRFISTVSHELRTPLIAILSQIEVLTLGDGASLSERQQTAAQRVTVNAQHLLRLITDLLDHAQIEAGQLLVLQPVPFAPAALLDDLRATLSSSAEAKGLTLTLDLSPDVPPHLIGDPERLKQILFNLTGNAIKFTERGTVAVQIARSDAEHWRLQVTDTGRGIAPDDQDSPVRAVLSGGARGRRGAGPVDREASRRVDAGPDRSQQHPRSRHDVFV